MVLVSRETLELSRFLTYFLLTFMQNVSTFDYGLLGGSKSVDFLWIIRRTLLYLSRYLAHLYKDKGGRSKYAKSHYFSPFITICNIFPANTTIYPKYFYYLCLTFRCMRYSY